MLTVLRSALRKTNGNSANPAPSYLVVRLAQAPIAHRRQLSEILISKNSRQQFLTGRRSDTRVSIYICVNLELAGALAESLANSFGRTEFKIPFRLLSLYPGSLFPIPALRFFAPARSIV
jgi:hypothetical protein